MRATHINFRWLLEAGMTEYVEGSTSASITGPAILWEDAADTLRVPSATKPLPVSLYEGGVAVSNELFYGTDDTVTVTLASLASAAWRQSAVVDNTTNKYSDAFVSGRVRTGSVAPTAGSTINLYVYAYVDSSNYSGGCSGSDAAYTADGPESQLTIAELTAIVVDASTAADYKFPPRSICAALGLPVLPKKWGIVARNQTGQTLDTTGSNFVITYYGVR